VCDSPLVNDSCVMASCDGGESDTENGGEA